ncbi:hypothetical protein HYPSUDRAFT_47056 [Hypholoma sublateritium FD-334 SS-4]|uniref:Uncharacterized protein n=1 Tax=Hypholoma sublateritium (strain FD-334 SS-4) TaxID=945553 RepID=A0A0D2NJQ1_HYPSF|nr:hypothetical protein HYPSUDRAFT_47056 [Hypholoma sublateritium FD-334 SS-4]
MDMHRLSSAKHTSHPGGRNFGVVNALLGRMDPQAEGTSLEDEMVLKLQDKLVNLKKFIPETDVGKALKYNLQDLVEVQLAEVQRLPRQILNPDDPKLREELHARRKLLESLRESQKRLHIPLAHRLYRVHYTLDAL